MRRQPVFSPNLWWRCLTLGASRKCPGSAAVNNDNKSKAMPVVFSRHSSAVPLTRTTRNSGHAVQVCVLPSLFDADSFLLEDYLVDVSIPLTRANISANICRPM